jgi:hypothetical protein
MHEQFVRDGQSGLYTPKTYSEGTNRIKPKPGDNRRLRLFTDPKRDWLSMLIGFLTLVVVGLYTYFASLQWKEMRKATDATEKAATAAASASQTAAETLKSNQFQFRLEQRPYITITLVEQTTPLQEGASTVTMAFNNSGRTPAMQVKILPDLTVGKRKLPVNFKLKSESTLASDRLLSSPYTITLNSDDFKMAQTDGLYFTGVITYTDIFKEWHKTTFCAFYNNGVYKFCEHGNDVY